MKEREKCKKTSHHRLQGAKWFSRYSISKSGIWARWTSPFCRFWALFSLKYDVTDAMLQDNEKMKVQYLSSLLFVCLKLCRLLKLRKGFSLISNFVAMATKIKIIVCYWKTKGPLFKQEWCLKSSLKQYSLIITAGSVKFWRKIDDILFLLWENNSLLFLNKG